MASNCLLSKMVATFGIAMGLFIIFATHIALAGGVVGDGTPASCTEAALDAALVGGGTVTFNCGGPATITLTSAKDITQNTQINGGGVITLTGGLATRLFRVGATTTALGLSNIILDRGYYNNSSGGAIWNAGALTLSNVTIQGSGTIIQYCGGALLTAGETRITNSSFRGNFAGLGGGAICVRSQPGTKVRITGSFFFNNQALDPTNGYGGALYVEYGTALVRDTAFLLNSAHLGGAVATLNDNAVVTLKGSPSGTPFASKMQLNANTASEDGGGIYVQAGSMAIDNAVISVNRTPTQTLLFGYGGGIHSHGVLTLTNSIVAGNEGRYGGGVFVGNDPSGASAWIEGTRFINNVSGNLGGGLYANTAATVTISNSTFSGNTAVTGGGLGRFNSALNVYDSSFTYNTAFQGGGLFLGAGPGPGSGPYVRVQSVTVSGNTATSNHGGGVFNSGLAELYSMTIVTNTNGVYSISGGNTRFRDTVLQNPGYLNCDGDGTASISDDARNFSTDNSCPLPNSQTGIGLDPRLGPLTTDAFGPTSYHMPLDGSPLIDAGFNCPPRDQRGALRVGACDIGAVEYGGLAQLSLAKTVVPTANVAYRGVVTYTVLLSATGGGSDPAVRFTDTLPAQVDFARWVAQPTGATVHNDQITWGGALSAGQVITFTFRVTNVSSIGGTVTNTARFSGTLQAGSAQAVFGVAPRLNVYLPVVRKE